MVKEFNSHISNAMARRKAYALKCQGDLKKEKYLKNKELNSEAFNILAMVRRNPTGGATKGFRRRTRLAVGRLEEVDRIITMQLFSTTHSSHAEVLRALAKSSSDIAIPLIREFLRRKPSGENRAVAIEVLGDPKFKQAIPLVRAHLTDPDPKVKIQAIRTLVRMNSRGSIPLLEELVQRDEVREVRTEAITAIKELQEHWKASKRESRVRRAKGKRKKVQK